MAMAKSIYKWTRVVPVRFARVPDENDPTIETGVADANAPDLDDRGYFPTREGHGCFVMPVGLDTDIALAARHETRVRLIREDMENNGTLYVTCDKNERLDLTVPAPGDPLPNNKEMMIKLKAKTRRACFLQIRFGAVNGPVIQWLRVVVNELIDLNVKGHAPVINGFAINDSNGIAVLAQSANNTQAAIQGLFAAANAIYFPYGIRFVIDATVDVDPLNFNFRGSVDFNGTETDDILQHKREANMINAYFVPQIIDSIPVAAGGVFLSYVAGGLSPLPVAFGPGDPINGGIAGYAMSAHHNLNDYGLVIADWSAIGQTIAHEMGHILNLVNDIGPEPKYIHVNTRRNEVRFPGTGKMVRDDIISRRRLMWAFTNTNSRSLRNFALQPPPANYNWENIMPYRRDVGYGANLPGSMLAIKQFNHDRTDWEMGEVRRAAGRDI